MRVLARRGCCGHPGHDGDPVRGSGRDRGARSPGARRGGDPLLRRRRLRARVRRRPDRVRDVLRRASERPLRRGARRVWYGEFLHQERRRGSSLMTRPFDVADEEARLEALRGTSLLDSAPEEAFDRLTRMATAVLKVPISIVSPVDRERLFFKSVCGLQEPLATLREGPI